MEVSQYLKKALEDDYVKIERAKNKVSYQTREGIKSYSLDKPEENVRTEFYSELVYKYKYEPKKIGLEVEVPRRKPSDWADIVLYEDDNGKKPYVVVECKRDGISDAEIKQAIEQVFGNANSLRGKYALVVAGSVRIAFDVANYPPNEREKNIISDIPIRYGQVPKYTYRKGARGGIK
jgi:type I restriction enzyme M protein